MEKKQLLQNNNGFVGFYPNTHVPFYQLQINIGSNKSYENFTVQQTVTISDDFIDTFNKTEEGEAIYIRVDIISDTLISGDNTPIFEGYKGSSGLYFTHTPISNPGKENERIFIRNFNITNIDVEAKTANVQFNQRILNNNIKFNTGSNEVTQYMGGTWNTYTFKKDDNNGNPVLALISDFTNLPEVQSIESIHGYGIGGHGIIYRASNNMETAPIIQPFMIEATRYFESVGNGSSRLFTSLYDVQPVTVTYNSKEYVGLILRGSGSIINILGYGLSLLSEPIYLNYIDNNTPPSNVVINDKSTFYEKLNLNSDRHNLLATSSSDGYMAQEDKAKVDKIITNGDGTKYLSDNGTYKAVPQPNLSNYLAKNNTTEYTPTANYHPATKKYVDDISIPTGIGATININGNTGVSNVTYDGLIFIKLTIVIKNREGTLLGSIKDTILVDGSDIFDSSKIIEYSRSTNDKYIIKISAKSNIGNGSIYIYGNIIERTLTESEYIALGDSVNTDGVLYRVIPD